MITVPPGTQPYFGAIQAAYNGRKARKSGLPYIKHIAEGLALLQQEFNAGWAVQAAWCLHPLYQDPYYLPKMMDPEYVRSIGMPAVDPGVAALVVDYIQHANEYLPPHVYSRWPVKPKWGWTEVLLKVDKVQNRMDFENQHYAPSEWKSILTLYFDHWFEVLGITPDEYQRLVKLIALPEDAIV